MPLSETFARAISRCPGSAGTIVSQFLLSEAKESFQEWNWRNAPVCPPQGYKAPESDASISRNPARRRSAPLGVPTVSDRALQRSTA